MGDTIPALYAKASTLMDGLIRLDDYDFPIYTAADPAALKQRCEMLVANMTELKKGKRPGRGFMAMIPAVFTAGIDYIVTASENKAVSSEKLSKSEIEERLVLEARAIADALKERGETEEMERLRRELDDNLRRVAALPGEFFQVHIPSGNTWRAIVYDAADHSPVSKKITIKKKSGLVFPQGSQIDIQIAAPRKRRADALPTIAEIGIQRKMLIKRALPI